MSTQNSTPQTSLYEKMGGESNVRNIVNDTIDKNASNPLIAHHFEKIDLNKLKTLVFEFFSMGTGGPHSYTGRDMLSSHTGLNITDEEWDSATEDTIWALEKNGIKNDTLDEVLAILESLKGQIVGV